MTLHETYKQRLNRMIVEEHGISYDLHEVIIPSFQHKLRNEIKNTETKSVEGVLKKSGRFEFTISGNEQRVVTFRVYWQVFFFRDEEEFKKQRIMNGLSFNDKMLFISISYINSIPVDNTIYDTIGHELEHAFQNALMGHDFGNQKIYNIMRTYMNTNNTYDAALADIVYASAKSEQEGMINGFYNEFRNGNVNPLELDKEIEESECGLWLKRLYVAYDFLKKHRNDNEMLAAVRKYKHIKDYYDYKYFLKIARNGIKNFERRIANLTVKIKKTIWNHQTHPSVISESFDIVLDYYLIR